MDWYYLQMREAHAILAWFSVALFLARGAGVQFGANWPLDSRLSVMVFFTDTLLTVSGLSLWVLMHFSPLQDAWFGAKLLALVAYTGSAYWAMGRGEFRLLGYLLALLSLAYIMGLSITRQVLLGL